MRNFQVKRGIYIKKIITAIMVFVFLVTTTTLAIEVREVVANIASFRVEIDNREINFSDDIVTINDKTYIPLRYVSEALGNSVEWDNTTKTISINSSNDDCELFPFK